MKARSFLLALVLMFPNLSFGRSLWDMLTGTPDIKTSMASGLNPALKAASEECPGQKIYIDAVRQELNDTRAGNFNDVFLRMALNRGACDNSTELLSLAREKASSKDVQPTSDFDYLRDAIIQKRKICGVSVSFSVDASTREVVSTYSAFHTDTSGRDRRIGIPKVIRSKVAKFPEGVQNCLRRPIFTDISNCKYAGSPPTSDSDCRSGMINCEASYTVGSGTPPKSMPIAINSASFLAKNSRMGSTCQQDITGIVRDNFAIGRPLDFKIDESGSRITK